MCGKLAAGTGRGLSGQVWFWLRTPDQVWAERDSVVEVFAEESKP